LASVVAPADHEHGVDFHLFGALDFGINFIPVVVDLCADKMYRIFNAGYATYSLDSKPNFL